MAKKEKSRLIPAIDVLHEAYTGPRPEPERIEDVYLDSEKRLGRLSFGYASKTRRENALLAERLAARTDWMIFPDTNQLDALGDELWEALLEHRRHVALTARVVHEIDGPLSRRTGHPLYRAVHDRVVLGRPPSMAAPGLPLLTRSRPGDRPWVRSAATLFDPDRRRGRLDLFRRQRLRCHSPSLPPTPPATRVSARP